jgi:dTDP-4-dehydrorhamnose 3,5-epimerase
MDVTKTPIEGLLLITPRIFTDDRGHFLESWNKATFDKAVGSPIGFCQDNESLSHRNVLRGLHFQLDPHAQGKLVHVLRGRVLDVVVDIREGSRTFGDHFKVELDGIKKQMLWIPEGFAHGFVSLEDETIFAYKCTRPYDKASERTILWNDGDLGIEWGVTEPIISPKDAEGIPFKGNWKQR